MKLLALPTLMLAAVNLHTSAITGLHYIILALGFGFVIFFHELGHFLAAKYVGVKVEQFAVGFGPAIFAWRKGLGVRRGTTTPEFERRVMNHLESHPGESPIKDGVLAPNQSQMQQAAAEMHISETEYRINWIPLGGYVKMLGQDDLNPGDMPDDPRAYNNKPISGRMLIISAGVIMNIILAAIIFMLVFRVVGFKAPPAVIGGILSDSPATNAMTIDGHRKPLAVGDRVLEFDSHAIHDFTKIAPTVALVEEGRSLPIRVQHVDGAAETLMVTPARMDGDPQEFLTIGIIPSPLLKGIDPSEAIVDDVDRNQLPRDIDIVKPGDRIIAINGQPIAADQIDQYWRLDRAIADSDGKPIQLTIQSQDGKTRTGELTPRFQGPFNRLPLDFGGMQTRMAVDGFTQKSEARGKIQPDDVIVAITNDTSKGLSLNPSQPDLEKNLDEAGRAGQKVIATLLTPDGKTIQSEPILPDVQINKQHVGLGISLTVDALHTVVSEIVTGSAADKAGIKPGSQITSIDGQKVDNWFQVRRIMAAAHENTPLLVEAVSHDGPQKVSLSLSQKEIDDIRGITFTHDIAGSLQERKETRQTTSVIRAAGWGVSETRDFVLQTYLTLRRMISGSISYKQTMGPLGIFHSGAQFADRGTDWVLWFFAMISANLAVVNFLPIPVVDGGQFVLLILEKIQGKPLSSNAQKIIQVVGLAMILGVFLLVTYQDLARIFGMA